MRRWALGSGTNFVNGKHNFRRLIASPLRTIGRARLVALVLCGTALTAGGITTAIGVLGTDDAVRTTAELVTVTRGLRQLGLSAWCHTGGYHLPPTTLSGTVRGDIALIDEIIGVGEVAISDHRSSQPTLDDLLRLASEAHVGGLMSGKAARRENMGGELLAQIY